MKIEDLNHRQKIVAKRLMNKGLEEHLAIKSALNHIFTVEESKKIPKKSKKRVKFVCIKCGKYSIVTNSDYANRLNGLAYSEICSKCILKVACNTEEHINNNSIAQLEAQNRSEVKYKQRLIQRKVRGKNFDNEKYDFLFLSQNYKNYLKVIFRNEKCYSCNSIPQKGQFHHIEYDKEGNKDSSISNLALLCSSCHTRYHNNERYNNNNIIEKSKETFKNKAIIFSFELKSTNRDYNDSITYKDQISKEKEL